MHRPTDSSSIVTSSHVTQLQNTKSARRHSAKHWGRKKSPHSTATERSGLPPARAPGSTSLAKSSTRTLAMPAVLFSNSTPRAVAAQVEIVSAV